MTMNELIERARKNKHKSKFQDEIIASIGALPSDDALAVIRSAIWCEQELANEYGYTPSDYEDVLHRDLLLAGKVISIVGGIKQDFLMMLGKGILDALLPFNSKVDISSLNDRLYECLSQLRKFGITAEIIIPLLNRNSYERCYEWVRLARVLFIFGAVPRSFAELVRTGIDDEDSHIQSESAEALGWLGLSSIYNGGDLDDIFDDPDSSVRLYALLCLKDVDDLSPQVKALLLKMINDSDTEVRIKAINIAGSYMKADPDIISALQARLNDRYTYVREYAIQALVEIGGLSDDVVDAIRALLKSKDESLLVTVIEALCELGYKTPELGDMLLRLNKLDDRYKNIKVVRVLYEYYDALPLMLNVLLALISDKSSTHSHAKRNIAVRHMYTLQITRPEIIKALLAASNDESLIVRSSVYHAFGELNVVSSDIKDALLLGLQDEEQIIQANAVLSLVKLKMKVPGIKEILLKLLDCDNPFVIILSAESFELMGDYSDDVLNKIVKKLRNAEFDGHYLWSSLGKLVQMKEDSVEA